MKHGKKELVAGLLTAGSLVFLSSTSHAYVYVEGSDAGSTLATASPTGTGSGTTLTAIDGTFGTATDSDLFAISITAPSTFSATTVNAITNGSGVDTALFLFNSSGKAIATNDDSSGTSFDAALPSGNSLYANLTAGTYYIGISTSGNEPINTASQLLFAGYPGGDTTAIRGPASGINPTTEATFNGNSYDTTTSGAYEIDLTSSATAANPASVPEPSSWAAVALGSMAAAFAFLRRRRSV